MVILSLVLAYGHRIVLVNVTSCRFDSHLRKRDFKYFHLLALVTRQSVVLGFTTKYVVPPEFGGKWGTKLSY